VEVVDAQHYERVVRLGGHAGTIFVRRSTSMEALVARVSLPASTRGEVTRRLTAMFDLDADVVAVRRVLGRSPVLARLIRRHPGIRVPGAWDPFEIVVRAIVGQQISVAGARTILERIVALASDDGGTTFPDPARLAATDVRGLGMPDRRADTVRAVARAVASGGHDLRGGPEEARRRLLEMPGIGPWTVEYIAMRAFGERDAFPDGDLVLRRAASADEGPLSTRELLAMAEAWRPWRAYATILLWAGASKR
jgi:AraC family transcriptional regulator of adaptative response / DNA-3-methyladenine glycosylase II